MLLFNTNLKMMRIPLFIPLLMCISIVNVIFFKIIISYFIHFFKINSGVFIRFFKVNLVVLVIFFKIIFSYFVRFFKILLLSLQFVTKKFFYINIIQHKKITRPLLVYPKTGRAISFRFIYHF